MFFNFFTLNTLGVSYADSFPILQITPAGYALITVGIMLLVCPILLIIGLSLVYSGYFNDEPVGMLIGVILSGGWFGLAMLAICHLTCQDKKLKYQAEKKLEEESLQRLNKKIKKVEKTNKKINSKPKPKTK